MEIFPPAIKVRSEPKICILTPRHHGPVGRAIKSAEGIPWPWSECLVTANPGPQADLPLPTHPNHLPLPP